MPQLVNIVFQNIQASQKFADCLWSVFSKSEEQIAVYIKELQSSGRVQIECVTQDVAKTRESYLMGFNEETDNNFKFEMEEVLCGQ